MGNKDKDKPSFFESDDSQSWPPADDSYKVDNPDEASKSTGSDYTEALFTDFDSKTVEPIADSDFDVDPIEIPIEQPKSGFDIDDLLDSFEQDTKVSNKETSTGLNYINELSAQDEPTKPFRSFASIDFSADPNLVEDLQKEVGVGQQGQKLNRGILIIALVALVAIGFYSYNKFTNRQFAIKQRAQRKPIKKVVSNINELDKDYMPLWDVTEQEPLDPVKQQALLDTLKAQAGRVNPFAVPDSILANLQVVVKKAEEKKQLPTVIRRNAFRASLIGVLTSSDSTVALINTREATFDAMRGSGKDKILKEATKAMDRARENALELNVNSYIGPWKIIQIEAPKGMMADAKVTLQLDGERRILTLGRAVELGIFDESGKMDNLEDPDVAATVDNFEW